MTPTFASRSAGIRSRISELTEHEYWGQDFANGECEFLLATKENGQYILVVTFGSWKRHTSAMRSWETINLCNEQTDNIVYTTTNSENAVIITNKNFEEMAAKYGEKKIPTWTLK